MHPEEIKQLILAGMACDFLELDGDGQHFQAIVVSAGRVGYQIELAPKKLAELIGASFEEIIEAESN